ncbi:hypothetical protein BC828DRAFT_397685 [Blastocladiella britannica]|nr:hypothetical protein BC828DRAFT_397685 [Blastocladiella britannica]
MPKEVQDDSVKHTCCGCMHIRRGVMLLQGLQLLAGIFGIVVGIMATSIVSSIDNLHDTTFQNADGTTTTIKLGSVKDTVSVLIYVMIAVYGVELLLALFGLYSVVKRNVGGFKFYTYASMALVVLQVVGMILSFNAYAIFSVLLGIYWCYVYYSYIETMKAEIEEIELKAAAPTAV